MRIPAMDKVGESMPLCRPMRYRVRASVGLQTRACAKRSTAACLPRTLCSGEGLRVSLQKDLVAGPAVCKARTVMIAALSRHAPPPPPPPPPPPTASRGAPSPAAIRLLPLLRPLLLASLGKVRRCQKETISSSELLRVEVHEPSTA